MSETQPELQLLRLLRLLQSVGPRSGRERRELISMEVDLPTMYLPTKGFMPEAATTTMYGWS